MPSHKLLRYAVAGIEEGRIYLSYGSPYLSPARHPHGRSAMGAHRYTLSAFGRPRLVAMLHKNVLISHFDGCDDQFVIGLDKQTGKTVWKTDRTITFDDIDPQTHRPKEEGEYRKASSSPIVTEIDGRPVLVSFGLDGGLWLRSSNGKELWRLDGNASTRALCDRLPIKESFTAAWASSKVFGLSSLARRGACSTQKHTSSGSSKRTCRSLLDTLGRRTPVHGERQRHCRLRRCMHR